MALLARQFLDAVVAIGIPDPGGGSEPVWIGTGFLFGKFRDFVDPAGDNDERNYRPFLVTNKHVIQDHDKFRIRLNR